MRKLLTLILTLSLLVCVPAMAEESAASDDSELADLPIFDLQYADAFSAALELEDSEQALDLLGCLLIAELQLSQADAGFDPAQLQGAYWIVADDDTIFEAFMPHGFWTVMLVGTTYAAAYSDLELDANIALDDFMDYYSEQNNCSYLAVNLENGYAQMNEMDITLAEAE